MHIIVYVNWIIDFSMNFKTTDMIQGLEPSLARVNTIEKIRKQKSKTSTEFFMNSINFHVTMVYNNYIGSIFIKKKTIK
jgi:hypothetical protein